MNWKYLYVVALAVATTELQAGSLEAKKDDVEVYSAPDKASSLVGKLKKGETVSSGDRNGMYWQVKLGSGGSGFVSVLSVKVKAESGGLNDALRDAVQAGRAATPQDGGRARSSVMGVRGLDDTSETAYAGSVRPNLRLVYSMEDNEITSEKMDYQADLVSRAIEDRMQHGSSGSKP